MKRYLPLLGVFLLFFLVISGFAHGQCRSTGKVRDAVAAVENTHAEPAAEIACL